MTKKLLLADDSITIQKVIGIIFATEDYQLTMTDNGDDAYEAAVSQQPDLVIADISMPGKDGFELCKAIKSDPRLVGTAVLLLPGTFEHFDEERAQAVAADGWLTKPFESQALLDRVGQLLEIEPRRLDGQDAVAAEEKGDFSFQAEEEAEPADTAVDEATLGLDEVEAVGEETTAEDIWDAVSFEEDDLQTGIADTGLPAEEEQLVDLTGQAGDETTESLTGEFAEDVPLELEEEVPLELEEVAAEEDLSAAGDFAFSDIEEGREAVATANETPLELTEEEVAEESVEPADLVEQTEAMMDAEPLEASENAEESLEEPLELVEEVEEASEEFTEEKVEEFIPEREIPVVEPLAEADSEEDVLELGESDILEEQSLAEDASAPESADYTFIPDQSAAEISEAGAAGLSSFEEEEPEEVAAEVESSRGGDMAVESPAEEDSDFYFDETETESEGESVEDQGVETVLVAEAEPAAAALAVDQVEQQLRELSDDELRDVVAKVAGPVIEKMAAEMLEKIAWDVVPDLAEAMIREEIRKIKQEAE